MTAMKIKSVEEIKVRLDKVKVVAVTCLGITNPLLINKRFDVCIMDEAGQTTLPVCTAFSRFTISTLHIVLFCRSKNE